MTFNAMGSKVVAQPFRGGRNKPGVWAQHLGSGCCDNSVAPAVDRLPATLHWENANIHTSPVGGRDDFHWATHINDSERRRIVSAINAVGVGAQIEVLAIPTFAFVQNVNVTVLAEEVGLTFKVVTRNGLKLPSDQKIRVAETTGSCNSVTRVKSGGDLSNVGALNGANIVYDFAAAANGGEFALESDVLILEVTSLPADGVQGFFDIAMNVVYTSNGRSEA